MRKLILRMLAAFAASTVLLLAGSYLITRITKPALDGAGGGVTIPKAFFVLVGMVWIAALGFIIFNVAKSGRDAVITKSLFVVLFFFLLFGSSLSGVIIVASAARGMSFTEAFVEFFGGNTFKGGNLLGLFAVFFGFASSLAMFITTLLSVKRIEPLRRRKPLDTVIGVASGLASVVVMIAIEELCYSFLKNLNADIKRKPFDVAAGSIVLVACCIFNLVAKRRRDMRQSS